MTKTDMDLTELLAKHDQGDLLRSIAEAVLQLMMESDVDGLIGVGRHERAEQRTTWRNGLSYDFPRLLCDKGAAAWHGIYAGQRRGSDRGKPGASPPRRSVIAPVFSSVLNGYPGSGPG